MKEHEKKILYQLIGKKINWYISIKKITQTALAIKLGIGRATLSNILSGNRQISFHLLIDIASELGADPTTLFPTIDELNSEFKNEETQIDKILEQKGISEKSQAAILNFINQPRNL